MSGNLTFNHMKKVYITLKNKIIITIMLILVMILFGCSKKEINNQQVNRETNEIVKEEDMKLKLFIDEKEVPVIWEDNNSVKALYEYVIDNPLSVDMHIYGGFEQVGSLGTDLPTDDHNITTQAGDIVLYNGNQIVIFFGSNSWAYTKLGKIDNANQDSMKQLLAEKDVKVTIIVE